MPAQELSEAVQDYLREIYKIQSRDGRASTSAIAEAMGVSPSSATSMVKKLSSLSLVEYAPYRGVQLTKLGEETALELIRHHRLLEQYLAETLDLPIDEVHGEADRLEHALSEELEARIDASLGHPTRDPHGDPIPNRRLVVAHERSSPLASVPAGTQVVIARVPDGDSDLLRYLAELGLVPGQRILVREAAPFGGPLTLKWNGVEHAISRELAAEIQVA